MGELLGVGVALELSPNGLGSLIEFVFFYLFL
jgi:hypothetical protein